MDINNLWSGYDLNSKKQNTRCLAVNTILEGKYLVGPVLGQGGFGITYVGYDLNMETKIAIKEYFPVELVSRDTTTMHGDRVLSLSGEKSVTYKAGLKKYVAEAQNVSQFSEIPGVVSVKDFFYANETAYIVMEFIDGISLKDYLKEKGGRLSEEETLEIMKPVLEALVQVHKAGIIHRDISPDNIMLTFKDGNVHSQIESVKLIDFGAARMTEKNDQKSLTIILKHGYAPEEQYRTHGEQGPWTDVYALCAVLYRMLTGETPVPAMDRMFKDELKSLEQCGAKVSVNTAAAILKGLAVKKDDRIRSVQELIGALYEGKKAISIVQSSSKSGIYAGIGVLSVTAVLVAVLLMSGGGKSETAVPVQETIVQVESIAEETQKEENVSDNSGEMQLTDAEELGEQIVFYHPQRSVAAPHDGEHVVFCKSDGTVEARGNNDAGQCDVEYWDHVAAVEAGEQSSFGLRTDGTVLYTGIGNGYEEVTLWTDIADIQATRECVVGLKQDGTIVSAVDTNKAKFMKDVLETANEVNSWTGIKSIASYNFGIYGLTEDGTVVVAGDELETEITGWRDVEHLVVFNSDVYGICEDGTIRASGDNEAPEGEFLFYDDGLGIFKDGTVYKKYGNVPQEISTWEDLVAISSPTSYAAGPFFGLRSDGTILEYTDVNDGDIAPNEMENLKSIHIISDGGSDVLFAVTKDNGTCKYGEIMEAGGVLNHDSTLCWYDGYAALYEDGTFLYATGSSECERIEGVVQVEEMLTHQIWFENETETVIYAYILLMEDGTVQRIGEGFDTAGYEYYEEVMENFADVELWTDIVQLEGSGLYDIYGLKTDGSLVGSGRYAPRLLGNMENQNISEYKQIGATENESLFVLKQDGTLTVLITTETDEKHGLLAADGWENVETFSIGAYHIAALMENGTVKATGGNHCGQCDVEEWRNIVYLKTGKNCTLGITAEGDLLMAGSLF